MKQKLLGRRKTGDVAMTGLTFPPRVWWGFEKRATFFPKVRSEAFPHFGFPIQHPQCQIKRRPLPQVKSSANISLLSGGTVFSHNIFWNYHFILKQGFDLFMRCMVMKLRPGALGTEEKAGATRMPWRNSEMKSTASRARVSGSKIGSANKHVSHIAFICFIWKWNKSLIYRNK